MPRIIIYDRGAVDLLMFDAIMNHDHKIFRRSRHAGEPYMQNNHQHLSIPVVYCRREILSY
jgi:hypothetical protein